MGSSIGFFISAHGFGHSARSCAIINEIKKMDHLRNIIVFTTTPKQFFQDSIDGNFFYYSLVTDIGFVQDSALEVNIPHTINALNDFYPIKEDFLDSIVSVLRKWNTSLIVCDISPLGIEVAKKAGIRCALIENFTWDWIYNSYIEKYPELRKYSEILHNIYLSVDVRIRTEPFCGNYHADHVVGPVFRKKRRGKQQIFSDLGIDDWQKMVLITMGGISESFNYLRNKSFKALIDDGVVFVIPCGVEYMKVEKGIVLLPKFSQFYHPDLINAADVVIGKLGYSTLAEVISCGVPFGFVMRASYPETDCMREYVLTHLNSIEISAREYLEGNFMEKIQELLVMSRRMLPMDKDPAREVAELLLSKFTQG